MFKLCSACSDCGFKKFAAIDEIKLNDLLKERNENEKLDCYLLKDCNEICDMSKELDLCEEENEEGLNEKGEMDLYCVNCLEVTNKNIYRNIYVKRNGSFIK